MVSEGCLEWDEGRMGKGDGVGSEGAELMARGAGINLDWGAFFILDEIAVNACLATKVTFPLQRLRV